MATPPGRRCPGAELLSPAPAPPREAAGRQAARSRRAASRGLRVIDRQPCLGRADHGRRRRSSAAARIARSRSRGRGTTIDSDGLRATQSVAYTVTAKPTVPRGKPIKPSIAGFKQSAKSWRAKARAHHGAQAGTRRDDLLVHAEPAGHGRDELRPADRRPRPPVDRRRHAWAERTQRRQPRPLPGPTLEDEEAQAGYLHAADHRDQRRASVIDHTSAGVHDRAISPSGAGGPGARKALSVCTITLAVRSARRTVR